VSHQDQTEAYRFVVREADGRICVALEPVSADIALLENGALGLDLRPGTTRDDAERFARDLNRFVSGVTYRED
jgi:hypothetical protein